MKLVLCLLLVAYVTADTLVQKRLLNPIKYPILPELPGIYKRGDYHGSVGTWADLGNALRSVKRDLASLLNNCNNFMLSKKRKACGSSSWLDNLKNPVISKKDAQEQDIVADPNIFGTHNPFIMSKKNTQSNLPLWVTALSKKDVQKRNWLDTFKIGHNCPFGSECGSGITVASKRNVQEQDIVADPNIFGTFNPFIVSKKNTQKRDLLSDLTNCAYLRLSRRGLTCSSSPGITNPYHYLSKKDAQEQDIVANSNIFGTFNPTIVSKKNTQKRDWLSTLTGCNSGGLFTGGIPCGIYSKRNAQEEDHHIPLDLLIDENQKN